MTQDRVDVRRRHASVARRRRSTLAVSLLGRLMALALRAAYRITVRGEFPPEGCVAVSAHDSYLDAVVPSALSPRVTPVVSKLCQRLPLNRWFLENYGVIWTGLSALPEGAQAARAGGVCWLAPLGVSKSRQGTTFRKPRSGAARIALAADRPIVGLSIVRRPRAGSSLRPVIEVVIGAPIHPAADETPQRLTARIAELLATTSPA